VAAAARFVVVDIEALAAVAVDTVVAGPVVDIVAVVEPVAEVADFRCEYILVERSACL